MIDPSPVGAVIPIALLLLLAALACVVCWWVDQAVQSTKRRVKYHLMKLQEKSHEMIG